jgi:hypothetical protein
MPASLLVGGWQSRFTIHTKQIRGLLSFRTTILLAKCLSCQTGQYFQLWAIAGIPPGFRFNSISPRSAIEHRYTVHRVCQTNEGGRNNNVNFGGDNAGEPS